MLPAVQDLFGAASVLEVEDVTGETAGALIGGSAVHEAVYEEVRPQETLPLPEKELVVAVDTHVLDHLVVNLAIRDRKRVSPAARVLVEQEELLIADFALLVLGGLEEVAVGDFLRDFRGGQRFQKTPCGLLV